MKRYLTTSLVLALLAASFFFYPQLISDGGGVAGQKRGLRRPLKSPAGKPRIDYSRFSHATKEHTESCKTCHKTPTPNWQKVRAFPDTADFPDHVACVRCHRPQFFKGAQPVICSDCHTKTSPRDAARFDFRNPVRPRQFTIEFPHDKHQDVIARLDRPRPPVTQTVSLRAFAHLRFAANQTPQTNRVRSNHCEICHVANTKPPVAPAAGWTDAFAPKADFFKSSPDSHASCFNCHWKNLEPTRDNCAGCHKPASPYLPAGTHERKSLRFTHEREQHVAECTACHINITKARTLRGLKPDVPITSCATSSCHNNPAKHEELAQELTKLGKDKQFICVYCHTSNVGKLDPPTSHSLAVGAGPLKRMDLK